MKDLILFHFVSDEQRAHWPSHEVIFFDAKNYKLYRTNSMMKFCKELNLTHTKMATLASGGIKSHKGLTVWTHGMPTNIQTITF